MRIRKTINTVLHTLIEVKEFANRNSRTSVDHIQKRIEHAVLGSGQVAEVGRSDIVVNVARIQVVGDVVSAEGSAEPVVPHPRQERDAEVLRQFEVARKKGWKAKAVGLAHIVLQLIDR